MRFSGVRDPINLFGFQRLLKSEKIYVAAKFAAGKGEMNITDAIAEKICSAYPGNCGVG